MLTAHVPLGAVNPVKSQGICGSCYAYAVTGAMEGAFFIKVKHDFLDHNAGRPRKYELANFQGDSLTEEVQC